MVLTGRYFPWADRLNALVLKDRKIWFHVPRPEKEGGFRLIPSRVMNLRDETLPESPLLLPEDVTNRFWTEFWRFLKPAGGG